VNLQSILQLLTALAAHLGVNAIPATMLWSGGASASTALVLYMLETPIALLLGAARVHILAPADDDAYLKYSAEYYEAQHKLYPKVDTPRTAFHDRREMIVSSLVLALFPFVIAGLFIALVLFKLNAPITSSGIASGMGGIIACQLFGFVSDWVTMGRISVAQANNIFLHHIRRAWMFVLVYVFGFLAASFNPDVTWFVTPFVIMRTSGDLLSVFLTFRAHVRLPRL
jgi:hypothetical protein